MNKHHHQNAPAVSQAVTLPLVANNTQHSKARPRPPFRERESKSHLHPRKGCGLASCICTLQGRRPRRGRRYPCEALCLLRRFDMYICTVRTVHMRATCGAGKSTFGCAAGCLQMMCATTCRHASLVFDDARSRWDLVEGYFAAVHVWF